MSALSIYSKNDIDKLLNTRTGELKIGERIQMANKYNWEQVLTEDDTTFVLLGICEDVGVRANGGTGGTGSAWLPFLKSFLNIQDNDFLQGASLLLFGTFNWPEQEEQDIQKLRQQTASIDDEVYPVIQKIISSGKIPIVIGGGHNNAYPLLKGASLALNSKVNAINLDAHADFRIMEGRHSGNGFRYAYTEGFLEKYAMLGLHEGYNNRTIIKDINNDDYLKAIFWEDIFLREVTDWQQAIDDLLEHVRDNPFGAELDADCIENILSSAVTPAGINMQQAMKYLYRCGVNHNAIYLHLPEIIYQRTDGEQFALAGKTLNYLVQAFIKGVNNRW